MPTNATTSNLLFIISLIILSIIVILLLYGLYLILIKNYTPRPPPQTSTVNCAPQNPNVISSIISTFEDNRLKSINNNNLTNNNLINSTTSNINRNRSSINRNTSNVNSNTSTSNNIPNTNNNIPNNYTPNTNNNIPNTNNLFNNNIPNTNNLFNNNIPNTNNSFNNNIPNTNNLFNNNIPNTNNNLTNLSTNNNLFDNTISQANDINLNAYTNINTLNDDLRSIDNINHGMYMYRLTLVNSSPKLCHMNFGIQNKIVKITGINNNYYILDEQGDVYNFTRQGLRTILSNRNIKDIKWSLNRLFLLDHKGQLYYFDQSQSLLRPINLGNNNHFDLTGTINGTLLYVRSVPLSYIITNVPNENSKLNTQSINTYENRIYGNDPNTYLIHSLTTNTATNPSNGKIYYGKSFAITTNNSVVSIPLDSTYSNVSSVDNSILVGSPYFSSQPQDALLNVNPL